jgi:hypothetical protein
MLVLACETRSPVISVVDCGGWVALSLQVSQISYGSCAGHRAITNPYLR